MKMALSRLEAEKRALQEELGRTESRSAKLELQRMSTEGDLQRLQMMLQEKDATIQVGFIARSALVSYLVFAEIARKVRPPESHSRELGGEVHVAQVHDRPVEHVAGEGVDQRERVEVGNADSSKVAFGGDVFVPVGGGKIETSTRS
jgi:hypothetical protein